MPREETVTVLDSNDEEIKVGSKVVYYSDHAAFSDEFGTNVGTVKEISDFDGDESRTITPFITVEWVEFKAGEEIPHTEDYMTSEWQYHPFGADEDGYPTQLDAEGKCEELIAVKDIQPRIIDPK